ncbi:MAG: hypothetical protein WKF57_13820 [Nakamurella sp.]
MTQRTTIVTVPGSSPSPRNGLAPTRSRRVRGVAVLAAGALIFGLTGCSDQVGAAATVGGVQIAESTVLADSTDLTAVAAASESSSPASPQFDVRQLDNRQVLTYRIRHQLLQSAADRVGVIVDEAQVTQALANGTESLSQQLGVPQSLAPQAVRDTLTVLALAQKTTAVTDVKVTITEQRFASRAEAVTAQAKAQADPGSFTGEGTEINLVSSAGHQIAPFGVFQVPDGSFVLVQQPAQDAWFVVRVDGRTESKGDLAKTLTTMLQSQDQAGVLGLSWVALAPLISGVQIEVNPRFGVWDPLSLQVVPALGS